MTIPSSLIETAALLLGAISIAWGLADLPARTAARRAASRSTSLIAPKTTNWVRSTATLLILTFATAAVLSLVTWALDGGPAAGWVGLGLLVGALPAIGIGRAADLVFASAPNAVNDAELAGLPRRASEAAARGGRTIAALAGGAAVCGFVAIFALSDVSPVALPAFMAGAVTVPVLSLLIRPRARLRLSARPRPDPTPPRASEAGVPLAPDSPLSALGQESYLTLAVVLAASTLVVEEFPLSWFLFTDALLLPLLIGVIGLWVALLGSWAVGAWGPIDRPEADRWAVGASVGACLIGMTGAVILVGGDETQLWVPVALGAVMVELVSIWALANSHSIAASDVSEPGSELSPPHAEPRTGHGIAVTAALAAILAAGLLGAFIVAGAPSASSYGFDDQIGWIGTAIAGMTFGAWAPSAASLGGTGAIVAAARRAAGPSSPGSFSPAEGSSEAPNRRWPGFLVQGYGIAATATVGMLALLTLVYIVPGRDAVSPSLFLPKLGLENPEFLVGVIAGILTAYAFSNRLLGTLGGRLGRVLLVLDALLLVGIFLGPVGLTGLALGGIAMAFALVGPSVLSSSSSREWVGSASEVPEIRDPAGGSPRGRPPDGPVDRHLSLLGRALPVAAVLLATIMVARVALGGV